MKFTEILEELKKGKAVKRDCWRKPTGIKYIELDQYSKKYRYYKNNDNYEEYKFSYDDIIADDWINFKNPFKRHFQPQIGDNFWYIDAVSNCSVEGYLYTDDEEDHGMIAIGNCFETSEDARNMMKKLEIINQLRKMSNLTFDYSTSETRKWYIEYDYDCHNITYMYKYNTKAVPFDIYFASKEDCVKAVETIGEDNLKKYYFDIVGDDN